MRVIEELREPPHECVYLPGRQASLDVRVLVDVDAAALESMLERGWRRFGPVYFRPACDDCQECLTLRIDVARFVPSKSQRRARKNAAHLRRIVAAPQVDAERLELYARWHADREQRRGWEESPLDTQRYQFDFAFPHPAVREVAFRDEAAAGRLVGLGIVDDTPNALSAAYFFWDPEHAPASLGTAHVVALVEEARARGKPHVYLGYRVHGCASLAYKARFQPHQLLEGRPSPRSLPLWRG